MWLTDIATKRPVSYREDAGKFTHKPYGWILHVVVGNGSVFNYFNTRVSPYRAFSHFWVSKTGLIEQYQDTDWKSWAQAAGNPDYISVETEGFPDEPLTDAQITALAKLHNALGTTDAIANTPGEDGIGVHYMGGQAWGGHSCPDPSPGGQGPRSHQRQAILDEAARLRTAADRGGDTRPPLPKPPAKKPGVTAPPFPLPPGWYFGPKSGPKESVSGYYGHREGLRKWQERMLERGWAGLGTADGLYGPKTARVAGQFQSEKHLHVDKLIGPVTWAAAWTEPVT